MKKELFCNHYSTEAGKNAVYTYKLIDSEINLCDRCEKKLRKQILQQIHFEDKIK